MRYCIVFFYVGLIVGSGMLYAAENKEGGERKQEVIKKKPRQLRNVRAQAKEISVSTIVLAAALGDAMGFPIERLNTGVAIEGTVYPDGVQRVSDLQPTDWVVLGDKKYIPYSDDTGMALDTFDSLIASLDANESMDCAMQRLARTYVAGKNQENGWAAVRRYPGNACWNNVGILERRIEEKAHFPAWWAAGAIEDGGCGSVMRAYPFGVLFKNEPQKAALWAAQHSKITHRAPMALAACAAMATGVAYASQGKKPEEIIKKMQQAALDYDAQTAEMIYTAGRWAEKFEITPSCVFRRFPGWAADDAIAAATYVFMKYPNALYDGLYCAANGSGDTDSVASMAGALIGSRSGNADQLPAEWLHNLEGRDRMKEIVQKAKRAIMQ